MTLTGGGGVGAEETLLLVSRYFFRKNCGGGGGELQFPRPTGSTVPELGVLISGGGGAYKWGGGLISGSLQYVVNIYI